LISRKQKGEKPIFTETNKLTSGMNKKIKIIIAGIGGVGGYFGGMLSKRFSESDDVEIYFLARGEHLKQIQLNGLTVLKGDTEFITRPKSATDNANEIGIADYIILCTKSYDLEKAIEQLKPCIDNNTAILPLLNGVDSAAKIKSILPNATVFNGCVYIVSMLKKAGVVENTGNIQKLFFGMDDIISEKLILLESIFKEADIEATLTKNISSIMWEKFHLVGANSTATSYFNNSTGEILADKMKSEFLLSLLNEVNQVALGNRISFDREMVSVTMEKLRSFPFEATSSMQRDFQKPDSPTELETITGFVVRAGKQLNIPTPVFKIAYDGLHE
jgi:2-dehydropantoate 2-reductase